MHVMHLSFNAKKNLSPLLIKKCRTWPRMVFIGTVFHWILELSQGQDFFWQPAYVLPVQSTHSNTWAKVSCLLQITTLTDIMPTILFGNIVITPVNITAKCMWIWCFQSGKGVVMPVGLTSNTSSLKQSHVQGIIPEIELNGCNMLNHVAIYIESCSHYSSSDIVITTLSVTETCTQISQCGTGVAMPTALKPIIYSPKQ